MNEDERDERLGRAILSVSQIIYAIGFIAVVSVIALVILLIIGKPLWIAPVIGVVVYLLYRLVLTAILRLLR
jgi:hypothetical protein